MNTFNISKIIFLGIGLFMFTNMASQAVTLTATGVNPVNGDVFQIRNCPGITPGNGGANLNWSFTNLTTVSSNTLNAVLPSSTPNSASFPQANICLQSSTSTRYYDASSSSLTYLGDVSATNGTRIFSNPEVFLNFPFNYNTTFTDAFFSVYVSSATTYTLSGTRQVTYDGYGTLSTPSGNFTNVARIRTRRIYTEATTSSSITYTQTQHDWYTNGIRYPLLTSAQTLLSISPSTLSSSAYLVVSTVGLKEQANSSILNLYPNPCTEQLNIQSNVNIKSLVFYNTAGELINIESSGTTLQDNRNIVVNTRSVPYGLYFVKLTLENGATEVRRLSIVKP